MRSTCAAVVGLMMGIGLATSPAAAQAPLHDSQYADADIAYGSALYASQCITCHGAQGDAIGGVNLRSGTFRNAVIDGISNASSGRVRRPACRRSRWTPPRWPASSRTFAT